MSDPVITPYGGAFIYYTCDRDPTATEPLVYNNYSDLLLLWWNTASSTLFWCLDNTSGDMNWQEIVTSETAADIILNPTNLALLKTAFGYNLNTSRSYASRSSPAFNTNYTPNATHDTFVLATVNISLSLLQSSTITAQINSGSGFVTVATAANSAVAINNTSTLSFWVPANSIYKIVSAGTGTNALNSIMELTM